MQAQKPFFCRKFLSPDLGCRGTDNEQTNSNFAQVHCRLGNSQINLVFRSPCTNFAEPKKGYRNGKENQKFLARHCPE